MQQEVTTRTDEHTHHHDSSGHQHSEHQVRDAAVQTEHQHNGAHAGHDGHKAHDAHAGHDAHSGHGMHEGHAVLMRNRFWLSLALTIPVLIYTPMIQRWLDFTPPTFAGSEWLPLIFSTIIFIAGGLVFLNMARHELLARQPGMMTLISIAITTAYVYSAFVALFAPAEEGFFWELATLIDVMLLGHWIEMRSVGQAQGALKELARLLPDEAERLLPDGATVRVAVSALEVGDRVLVRPGASVPADGEVIEGESQVNESMITGESLPVHKHPGAAVIGGTVNGSGSLRIVITKVGADTALAGIMRLVEDAQQSKSRAQVLAQKAAFWLTIIAVGAAIITFAVWALLVGDLPESVRRTVTVLVIACPHALGLAVPLVVAISTTLSARNGLLVRDRLALEKARGMDIVIFDKTGTLTKGEQGVVGLTTDGISELEALRIAAGVEGDSEHPIAQAIREAASAKIVTPAAVSKFESMAGRGVAAVVDGKRYLLGGPRLLEERGWALSDSLQRAKDDAEGRGQAVIYLADEERLLAVFAVADVIREESKAAVAQLHAMGVQVAMLTGDSEAVAAGVAKQLGIDTYFAEVLPEHKAGKVAELQQGGKTVAMVGDGVNDAPALAQADVGIAIGAGTDVAIESAGIILVRSDPRDIARIVTLSRASYRKMIQNLFWATGYNVIAIPLAMGVLAPIGFVLSPAIGAAVMSVSTIVVAINAMLLRRVNLAVG